VESPEDFGSVDDVYDAVGDVLLDSDPSSEEEDVREFCGLLLSLLHGVGGASGAEDGATIPGKENKLLKAPVQLSSKLKIGVALLLTRWEGPSLTQFPFLLPPPLVLISHPLNFKCGCVG